MGSRGSPNLNRFQVGFPSSSYSQPPPPFSPPRLYAPRPPPSFASEDSLSSYETSEDEYEPRPSLPPSLLPYEVSSLYGTSDDEDETHEANCRCPLCIEIRRMNMLQIVADRGESSGTGRGMMPRNPPPIMRLYGGGNNRVEVHHHFYRGSAPVFNVTTTNDNAAKNHRNGGNQNRGGGNQQIGAATNQQRPAANVHRPYDDPNGPSYDSNGDLNDAWHTG